MEHRITLLPTLSSIHVDRPRTCSWYRHAVKVTARPGFIYVLQDRVTPDAMFAAWESSPSPTYALGERLTAVGQLGGRRLGDVAVVSVYDYSSFSHQGEYVDGALPFFLIRDIVEVALAA